MKYYSGSGDKGKTLIEGRMVPKNDSRVIAIGELDDLSAKIGFAMSLITDEKILDDLKSIEKDIYLINSELSGYLKAVKSKTSSGVSDSSVKRLEEFTDYYSKGIKDITKFVYPNGIPAATALNICRTQARRAETALISANLGSPAVKAYINRLSSLFFVLFRWLNQKSGFNEELF